jgi:hypothetical protein
MPDPDVKPLLMHELPPYETLTVRLIGTPSEITRKVNDHEKAGWATRQVILLDSTPQRLMIVVFERARPVDTSATDTWRRHVLDALETLAAAAQR